ncbi:universal stress protein [Hymenobacter psychrophilus]|uniref:Nucleotide-binding universal stress protein, UspA family n=1 Tax=Hymenobacter psychrophilus TaxID=651662 RepID=A0A1H3L6M2_9BACT|nr:universal stress protein [Hymenobacter psychrophilus]SDY60167.1 Nucleotide-binding universal stress protein, UspA family [Hymenobacter psychrophilus]
MKPNLLVLTDSSPAAERACAYAAVLAAPLGAELHLLHVSPTLPLNSRVGRALRTTEAANMLEQRHALEEVAAAMPVPATATVMASRWDEAMAQALEQHRPLLVVAGLTTTDGLLDEWLSNRALPLAHETGYPLLMVPQYLPTAALRPPRCLALAVRDQSFTFTPEALALRPLLTALGVTIVPTTVAQPNEPIGGQHGFAAARESGLIPALAGTSLHRVVAKAPAAGLRQAVVELAADMLVLLEPGHGWLTKLFGGSVIDEVLRHTTVPVLLLATQDIGLD